MKSNNSSANVVEFSKRDANNLITTLQESLKKIKKTLHHYFEAQKHFENDSYQKAYKFCKTAIDINIDDQVINIALTKLLSKIERKLHENQDKKVTDAEREFKNEIQKCEKLIERQTKDRDKCTANCLAKSYHRLAIAWSRWGLFLYENENFIDAEQKYKKAIVENSKGLEVQCEDIDLNIHRAHFINGLGLIYKSRAKYLKALSKFDEAIKLYKEALEREKEKDSHSLIVDNIKENFAKTYINISNTKKDLANSYYSEKKYKEALAEYNRAIFMIQKSLEIFVNKYAYPDLSYLYECAANAVRMLDTI